MHRFRFGLGGLSGPLTARKLYGDQPASVDAYARMFQAYEVAASQYEHWTAANGRDTVNAMPSSVHLLPHLSQEIAQAGQLDGHEEEFTRWRKAIEPIVRAPNAGPLLVPWRHPWSADSMANLEHLLGETWPGLPSIQRMAVEFQHGSWFRPDAIHMLEEYGAGLVWSTSAGKVPYRVTADFVYIRLTGQQHRRVPDEAGAMAKRILARPDDERPVYVISSRHHDPYGLRVLQRFADLVGQTVAYGNEAASMPQQIPSQPSLASYA